MNAYRAVQKLLFQNIWRWRLRLLIMVALVTVAVFLYLIHGAYMESIVLSTQMSIDTLELPYFDMLIRLHPEERPLTRDELPATRYQRRIYGTAEPAHIVLASGEFGIIEFLGTNENSAFFTFAPNKLRGQRATQSNEIVVSQSFAELAGLALQDCIGISTVQPVIGRRAEMRIVGIYEAEGSYAPVLCSIDTLITLCGGGDGNAYLINYDRENATLEYLQEWMGDAYPKSVQLSSLASRQLAAEMLRQSQSDESGLTWYLVLFVAIAVYTISMITFIERRPEVASLKSIGITGSQVSLLLLLELLLASILGSLLGGAVVITFYSRLAFMHAVPIPYLVGRYVVITLMNMLITVIAIVFPAFTIGIASVNELLYARVIPLLRFCVSYMEIPDPIDVYRERKENVRILCLPTEDDDLFFKRLGDVVKRGEVVAMRISMSGYMTKEWVAPCDGVITEMRVGGLTAIRPEDEKELFHSYPAILLEKGKALLERQESGTPDE